VSGSLPEAARAQPQSIAETRQPPAASHARVMRYPAPYLSDRAVCKIHIMHDDRSHPLLQQTPLSVNPFIDLPKPPTLPHNYASIPSTLPPSAIHAPPAPSNPDLPAYVTSSTGFAAHPTSIINQSRALLDQLSSQRRDAAEKVKKWERDIEERELQEKRRRAPGWLDSEAKLLQPAKKTEEQKSHGETDLMDEPEAAVDVQKLQEQRRTANELGDAMDRAFGRSEMG